MGNFNRGNRSGGGRGFSAKGGSASGWERRGFNDRGSRGPAQMHQAVCDNCRKDCEVPFRPTSGKPVFCSSCFEGNRNSDFRSSNSESRQMFDAVCDECKNSCKVPFQPSSGKPIYCSSCFGEKKGSGDRSREQFKPQPQYTEQLQELNNKLDQILTMLTPKKDFVPPVISEEIAEDRVEPAKKKSSKKK